MTAHIEVLRSFAASGDPVPVDRLSVHFLAYGPSVMGSVNGTPPPLPHLPAGARAFLDREFVSALSQGTPREVFAIAGYLASQQENLTGELMPLPEPAIGDDRRRWAEVAAGVLAAQGIPRPSTADPLLSKTEPKGWPGRGGLFLAQTALQKLKASPDLEYADRARART